MHTSVHHQHCHGDVSMQTDIPKLDNSLIFVDADLSLHFYIKKKSAQLFVQFFVVIDVKIFFKIYDPLQDSIWKENPYI